MFRRIRRFRERSPHYGYWKRAAVTIFAGLSLSIAGLVWIYLTRGLMIAVGLGFAIIGLLLVIRLWRFVSPSSIRLQARIFTISYRVRRLINSNPKELLRNSLERKPIIGGISAALLSIIFALLVASFASNPFLQENILPGNIPRTIWIVHATVTGFSFVVLIFFWEYLGDEFGNPVLIRTAVRYTWALHIIFYLLAANVAIGILAILAQNGPETVLLGVQEILFLLSIGGVSWLYVTIYRVMVEDTLTPRVRRRLSQQTRGILSETDRDPWLTVVAKQLNQEYPLMTVSGFGTSQERITAGELGLAGQVSDIHLHRIHDVIDEAANLDVRVKQLPALGRSYDEDDDVLVCEGDLSTNEAEHLQQMLSRAVRVR